MNVKSLLAAATLALGLTASSQAAVVFLSTSSTGSQTVGVPSVTLNATPGQTVTGTLFAWININPATEGISGISLNLSATKDRSDAGAGSISAASRTLTTTNADNSTRFDFNSTGTLNPSGKLISNISLGAFSGSGINMSTFDGSYGDSSAQDAAGNNWRLWQLGYSITAPTTGGSTTYSLYLEKGGSGISFQNGYSGTTIGFGSANDTIALNAAAGTKSALADMSVTVVVPEPASVGLLGLGALGLVARRRRA